MTSTFERVRNEDGTALAADVYRHESARAVVILLHGGGQNRHAWATTARRLHARGYTVVAYDARGHGDSEWDPPMVDTISTDLHPTCCRFADMPAMAPASCRWRILGRHDGVGNAFGGACRSVGGSRRTGRHNSANGVSRSTPRRVFHGRHPDGFDTLDAAADVIAQYNRHRARPKNLDGLRKVLQQRDDGRWIWRWDPAFIASNFEFLQGDPATGAKEFGAISDLLIEGGARRVRAPTLLIRGVHSDVTSQQSVEEFLEVVPHAEAVDVSGTGTWLRATTTTPSLRQSQIFSTAR